jgi:hypothetical protein
MLLDWQLRIAQALKHTGSVNLALTNGRLQNTPVFSMYDPILVPADTTLEAEPCRTSSSALRIDERSAHQVGIAPPKQALNTNGDEEDSSVPGPS